MTLAAPAAHWHRTLWAMLSVQFVVSSAFSIAPPLIPLVLPQLGVVSSNGVRIWAGVLVGVTPLAAALMSPRWGRFADRFDRRWLIVIACTSAAICTAALSLTANPWEFLGLRFAMGLFGGHAAAGLAIVSAATPAGRLGWALGLVTMGQLAGSLLGPLLGGTLADAFGSVRVAFLLAGAGALLVAGLVAFVPPEVGRAPSLRAATEPHDGVAERARSVQVRNLVVALLLAQCAIMMTQPIISLYVRDLPGSRGDIATRAGLAFSVVGLGGLLAAPLLGALSDRLGARRLLFGVATCAAALVIPQAYAGSYTGFVMERLLAGIFLCSLIPLINSLVGNTVRAEQRGHAYGLTSGAAFLGAFIGPVSGGLLGAHLGLPSVFLISAGVLAGNAAWIAMRILP